MTVTHFLLKRVHARSLPRAAAAATLALALGACSSSPPLFLSDGRTTTQVQCPSAGNHESCRQQAHAQCGDPGFDTIDQSDQNGAHTLVFACRGR